MALDPDLESAEDEREDLLATAETHERYRHTRGALTAAAAVTGAPVWTLARWPGLLARSPSAALLAVQALALLALALVVLGERLFPGRRGRREPRMSGGDEGLLVLRPTRMKDPGGKKLAATLRAHLAFERLRAMREALVRVVAWLGVAVWPLAAWPTLFDGLRSLVLATWAATFTGLAAVWVKELLLRRLRARLSAELRAPERG